MDGVVCKTHRSAAEKQFVAHTTAVELQVSGKPTLIHTAKHMEELQVSADRRDGEFNHTAAGECCR